MEAEYPVSLRIRVHKDELKLIKNYEEWEKLVNILLENAKDSLLNGEKPISYHHLNKEN